MITKNFKNILALMLQSRGNNAANGLLSAVTVAGATVYMAPRISLFPYSVTSNVTFSAYGQGIRLGTGDTPATENDYNLVNQIVQGLSAQAPSVTVSTDANGNPILEHAFTVTNTTGSDIIIREIGYAQSFYHSATKGASAGTSSTFLLDRTVLESPVTVPANDYAAIKYALKTVIA